MRDADVSRKRTFRSRAAGAGIGALAVAGWGLLARVYPVYILPSPLEVIARAASALGQGLPLHFAVTAAEALGGFLIGAAIALPLGYLLARIAWLERAVAPYIVASQAVPIVALAPLLIIWFGFGPVSKLLVAALVAFFPVLTNVVVGLRRIERNAYELMAVMGASRWQVFAKLEIPGALPVMLAGFRVGLALSVIGAVVGEFVSSDTGLGYLVNMSAGMLDTPLMFVALFSLALLGISFHIILLLVERHWFSWFGRPIAGRPDENVTGGDVE